MQSREHSKHPHESAITHTRRTSPVTPAHRRVPPALSRAGNLATLRNAPAAAGRDVTSELAAFWRDRYVSGSMCGCVVGPQPLEELQAAAEAAFSEVRVTTLCTRGKLASRWLKGIAG